MAKAHVAPAVLARGSLVRRTFPRRCDARYSTCAARTSTRDARRASHARARRLAVRARRLAVRVLRAPARTCVLNARAPHCGALARSLARCVRHANVSTYALRSRAPHAAPSLWFRFNGGRRERRAPGQRRSAASQQTRATEAKLQASDMAHELSGPCCNAAWARECTCVTASARVGVTSQCAAGAGGTWSIWARNETVDQRVMFECVSFGAQGMPREGVVSMRDVAARRAAHVRSEQLGRAAHSSARAARVRATRGASEGYARRV